MIAVGREDAGGFVLQPLLHDGAAKITPQPAFRLEIEAHFIGGGECGFGRTPGMKADAVKSIILARLDDFFPRGNIHRGITGQRKIATEMGEAEVDGMAVDEDVFVARGDFAEAKGPAHFRVKALTFDGSHE